jgi:vacuolar-type H+-ATPase catalytic subunit A/Vma1
MLGYTFENDLFAEHRIMASPKISGRIVELMPAGQYTVAQPIAILETNSGKKV